MFSVQRARFAIVADSVTSFWDSRCRDWRPWPAKARIRESGSEEENGNAHVIRTPTDEEEADWSPQHLLLLDSLFQRPLPNKKKKTSFSSKDHKQLPSPFASPSSSLLRLPTTRLPSRKPADRCFSQSRALPKDSSFLKRLASEVHALPLDADVRIHLDPYARILRRGSLSGTIRELGHMDDPARALHIFFWQQHYPHLWPDHRTLSATLEVLAESGAEHDVWKLLNSSSLDMPSTAFEAAILGFLKQHRLAQALQVKDIAQKAGFTLDQRVYAKIIYVASHKIGGDKLAMELINELGSFPELRLKLEDCTTLMSACNKIGQYEAVESLYRWWKSAGYHPNVVMLTILMKAHANSGNHYKALAVYEEMDEFGCVVDLPAFRVLLESCLETGETRMALKLFGQMKDNALPLTSNMYGMLVKLCLKDGMSGKVQSLLKEMQGLGLTVNSEIKEMVSFHKYSAMS